MTMKLSLRGWLFCSLLFNALFILFFIANRIYYAESGKNNLPVDYDIWNESRNSVLKVLPIDSSDVVFIGNSITEGFPVQEMFPGVRVKNRGIGGNQSRHVKGRIDAIAKASPREVFLDIGINDIIYNVPLDSLFQNYKEIIAAFRIKAPRTKIVVQSVLPVGHAYEKFEPLVEKFNQMLKDYCNKENIVFVDIFSLLQKDGRLDSSFSYDDLHINGKAYMIWAKTIDPLVRN